MMFPVIISLGLNYMDTPVVFGNEFSQYKLSAENSIVIFPHTFLNGSVVFTRLTISLILLVYLAMVGTC